MLQRLIGEDVELVTELADDLGRVRADRGQLEQVIMNLCVNARDAMPHGGRLSLSTANEQFPGVATSDEEAEGPHGRQVALVVSDSGTGMSPATQERAFEPFFTTKDRDKGTGLGLSTVYGSVRQSGGHILLRSEPGKGTTFRIYLPRRKEEAAPSADAGRQREAAPGLGGGETILLVEDEGAVRELSRDILGMHGYCVLEAADGREALQVYEGHDGKIDLLLTDVIMPLMGGHELGRTLRKRQGDLEVLYVSGYTDEVAFRDGGTEQGAWFLAKPFTPDQLAAKLRSILDRTPRLVEAGSAS
jgi:two-component system cell cycle sensor histidine kinase/response regulator CckA